MTVVKRGLVLEGGAYRGMFTAGVLDVMMEHDVAVDGVVGVSAGAAFGVNFLSGQAGRALRYNQRFAKDRRYGGLHSLLTTGDLYNAEFCYHVVPVEYDEFDYGTFLKSGVPFYVVCTDVTTGEPVYHLLNDTDFDVALEWIRASASMPMVSNVVEIGGARLLDGGMTDSIPLQFMQRQGFERNVVVLTQPLGYEKHKSKLLGLMKLGLRKTPKMYDAMARRHAMYNAQVAYVAEQEKAGNVLVIRPPEKLAIGHTCHDPQLMAATHKIGHDLCERMMGEIERFLQ